MANRAGTYGRLVDSCRTLQFDYDVPHFRRVISMLINLINLIACIAASKYSGYLLGHRLERLGRTRGCAEIAAEPL